MQTVIDLDGKPIQVTDLQAALKQAREFAGYQWVDNAEPASAFFEERKQYWQHLLTELEKL